MITNDAISVLSSPLSTVIVGSVVGAGVGFFLNYQTTRMTRKGEQKKALQEHIREFSTLTLQIEEALNFEKNHLWSLYEVPDSVRGNSVLKRPECPVNELIMLTILHLPELKKEALELRESIDEVRGCYENFFEGNDCYGNNDISEGPTYFNQSYAAVLQEAFGRYNKSYSKLLDSIESIGRKYR